MKKLVAASAALLILVSCAIEWGNENSEISINLGLGNRALSDRTLPPLQHIELIVEGPGMPTLSQTFPLSSGTVNMQVPSGPDRRVRLRLPVVEGSPSNVIAFGAEKTVNLLPRQTTSIALTVVPVETEYIFADPGAEGATPRLVRSRDFPNGFGDLTGLEQSGLTPSFTQPFKPVDVDYDRDGNVYFASDNGSGGGVFQVPYIAASGVPFTTITTSGRTPGITIDRERNILYFLNYATIHELRAINLNSTPYTPVGIITIADSTIDIPMSPGYDSGGTWIGDVNISNPSGHFIPRGQAPLAVGPGGAVFLWASYGGGRKILKIDPSVAVGSKVLEARSLSSYNLPAATSIAIDWEVMDYLVRGDYLFALLHAQVKNSGENFIRTRGLILALRSTDLSYVAHYGYDPAGRTPDDGSRSDLPAPRRFIGVVGRKITFVDEGGADDRSVNPSIDRRYNRIVALDGLGSNGFQEFPVAGVSSPFGFFSDYNHC